MAEHRINIDIIDITVPEKNNVNIAVVNKPNRVYGYSASAAEVYQLIQIHNYQVYEAGTNKIITGSNYYDYFPEEGGGGGGGGVTPEEVQNMINSSMSTLAPVASSGDYDDLIDKPVIDSAASTKSTNAIQNKGITNFVNSSIETATATFRGTYTTIETLNAASGDKNDYAFYNHTDAAGNTVFDRYKFVPTEQADLPEGYTQLEYIESSGTQYIDTGVLPTSKTRSYIKLDPLIYRYATCFFGTSGYSNRGYHDPYYLNSDNESGKFRIDGVAAVVSLDFPGVNEFEYNYPYITLNGDSVNIGDPGEWYYGAGNAIYLFASNSNGQVGSFATMRLYGFKLYDTDGVTLIRDFVPCKNASNIAGLYDLINSTFYPNNGTGSFIAGPQANGYWEYEYTLNNSSFTADQWATINSGITSSDKTQIGTNTNDISSLNTNKLDKTGTAAKATADSAGNNIITTYAKKTDLNDLVCTFRGIFNTQQAMDAVAADKNDTAILQSTDANGNTIYTMESYVTVEPSGEIPEGYTQLLYIQSSGAQYIDTGVTPSNNRRIYIKFNPLDYMYNVTFFGLTGFSDRGFNDRFQLRTDAGNGMFFLNGGSFTAQFDFPGINEFEYNYPSMTINGNVSTISNPGTWGYGEGSNIYLFACRDQLSTPEANTFASMYLYGCKIYDTDGVTLVRDFVPVRNSNNEVGLYDVVGGAFYSNQGSGSFIAGPASNGYWVTQYSFLASIQGSLDAINAIIEGVL